MNAKKKILLVDDEADVTEVLRYNLKKEGYLVEALNNPLRIIGVSRDYKPDLIILDIMMPELSGIQACRMIREDPNLKGTPIIFLTARNEGEDRIQGLETGADDYLAKPFEFRELLLRIKGLLRRSDQVKETPSTILNVGPLHLDEEHFKVTAGGEEITLTATEFKLLQLLMERKGRVQSRENLLVNVWNYDADVETRTVDTHIRRLREKLGQYGDLIQTVRGVGYRVVDNPQTR